MKHVREILRFLEEGNLSNRQIAKSCNCSPSTVTAIAERVTQVGITWPVLSRLSDPELEAKLYPQEIKCKRKPLPDYDYVHKELMKKGVTRQLLWSEYKEAHPDGMNYTQFCHKYLTWCALRKMSMHQIHKAGEKAFVDWAGLTGEVIDQETGEIRDVYYFVAALGASDLLFTEVYPDMSLASWIDAHVKAFEYFAGIPEIVVPDNCKTAIKKPCYYEPELNATYAEMASHYGCAVIPARVKKSKDKPLAEGGVQIVERWIIAKLRNQRFFSLYELRSVVRHLLDEANSKPFQKREGSRRSIWETIEKPLLRPLPAVAYEFADLKKAKVNVDYHVEIEGNYYSVPYQLIKQEVLVRITTRTIEVLAKGVRVASHARQIANKHIYSTLTEHMPPNHRKMGEWTPERIITWAHSIGTQTSLLVETILHSKKHPQQAYRSCLGIIRLAKAYGQERVERACLRALRYGAHSYQSVRSILEKNLDMEPPKEEQKQVSLQHENIRGISYYSSGEVH